MKEKKVWQKLKNIILWRPSIKLVAPLAIAALVLLIVPLLRMALYTAPWYDDYNYGGFVKRAMSQDDSLVGALKGAVECARVSWYAWQGTFSSIFFMSFAPFVWDMKYYFLGPFMLILILPVSTYVLTGVLLRGVLKAERACSIALQAAAAAITVEFIHSDRAGFYWYNPGVHYVGMHSLLILTLAGWSALLYTEKKKKTVFLVIWSILGAVLAGGANYVTALQGLLLIAGLTVLGIFLRKKRTLLLLPSLLVYIVSFAINATAPGNDKRGALFQGLNAPEAILRSFKEGAVLFPRFTGLQMLAAMLMILPLIWHMLKKVNFRFRLPGVVLALSYCFYATGFTPSLYAMGTAGLGRTLNAVKITLQLLLLVNEVYLLGWLWQKAAQKGKAGNAEQRKGVPAIYYLAIAVFLLAIFRADTWKEGHFSSYCAYLYVHLGQANEFHKEYLDRVERIENGGDVVEVPPYHFKPAPICAGELSSDPGREENASMASWYGKQAIICIENSDG